MIENWGGAQWVLMSWLLLFGIVAPLAIRVADLRPPHGRRKTAYEFMIFYVSKVLSIATLVAVLWWGGFWS